jgi:hypothetical protein
MKSAPHLPRKHRDDIARLALSIRRTSRNQEEAKKIVAGMFKVSPTTARNLIMRGKFLAGSESDTVALSRNNGGARVERF